LIKIMELDDKALTPSDYCLMGMHMKFEDYTSQGMKDEIKEYFLENFDMSNDLIEYINISFKINKYYKLSQRFDELHKNQFLVDQYLEANSMTKDKYLNYLADGADGMDDFPRCKDGYSTKPIDPQEN